MMNPRRKFVYYATCCALVVIGAIGLQSAYYLASRDRGVSMLVGAKEIGARVFFSFDHTTIEPEGARVYFRTWSDRNPDPPTYEGYIFPAANIVRGEITSMPVNEEVCVDTRSGQLLLIVYRASPQYRNASEPDSNLRTERLDHFISNAAGAGHGRMNLSVASWLISTIMTIFGIGGILHGLIYGVSS